MLSVQFSSVQLLSRVQLFVTPWIAARQASLSITNSRSSPRLTSTESVMPSSHFILHHPLLLLPPISPSIRVYLDRFCLPVGPQSSMTLQIEQIWRFWNGLEVPVGKSGATIEDLEVTNSTRMCNWWRFSTWDCPGVTESDTTELLSTAQHKHK